MGLQAGCRRVWHLFSERLLGSGNKRGGVVSSVHKGVT